MCENRVDILNEEQNYVFRIISDQIDSSKKQLLLFVSGEGGTGKSILLRKCFNHCKSTLGHQSCTVVAPTGVAAYNVFGSTIHSAFKIPIDLSSPSENEISELKIIFADLKWLFIDEISMVSNQLFECINCVLKIVKSSTEPFGDVNVIVFGDLLQLNPINGTPIFFHHLWKYFNHFELIENERQKKDPIYHRICQKTRIGQHSNSEVLKLEKRKIENLQIDERDQFKNAIHVFSTRKLANLLNKEETDKLKEKQDYIAKDSLIFEEKSGTVTQNLDENSKFHYKSHTVQDIPFILTLGVNSRVMIKSNICVENGLVNGRTGTVTKLNETSVLVLFDDTNQTVEIGPIRLQEQIRKNKYLQREQIPLMPAWAVTAHKIQGLTLPKIVTRFDVNDLFCWSLGSVILSRVRSIKDIAFIEFNKTEYELNKPYNRALKEVQRLKDVCI